MADLMPSLVSVLDALRELRLLKPDQLSAIILQDLQGGFSDSPALGKELIQRGWLTPFQVNQLLQDKADELLVGPYILLERLGAGGAGQVFKARHQKMNRVAAVKVIRPDLLSDAEMVSRFYREIEAVSQLVHPNIVHAYDAGPIAAAPESGSPHATSSPRRRADGPRGHFLAMEYLDGIDLAKRVKESGPLSIAEACDYIRQAALGLQYVFENSMVHRDVKPSNLMIVEDRGSKILKILDLGLARFRRGASGETISTLTDSRTTMMGTVDYMAPEQAIDSHEVNIRADIYSLGCTLFYLLTGQPPFSGGTDAEKLVRHQLRQPPAIRELRPEVPEQLAAVVATMLAKSPEDRFRKPVELIQALTGETPVTLPTTANEPRAIAQPVGITGSESRRVRLGRRWHWVAVPAGVSCVLLVVGWLVGWPGKDGRSSKQVPKNGPAAKVGKISGLVGHYAFDEGMGTRVTDGSPVGNHGTLMGGVAWTAGRRPGKTALSFDGKTGYVQCDQNLTPWLGGTATVVFWIKTTQVGKSNWFATGIAGSFAEDNNDVHWGSVDPSGRIAVSAGDRPNERTEFPPPTSTRPINDGQWHHVAMTRDALSGQVQVYVDGVLNATGITGKGVKTTGFVAIGRSTSENPGFTFYFRGALGDVRLFNRLLSSVEIQALAQ
jgi:serine/threonine protein kinase